MICFALLRCGLVCCAVCCEGSTHANRNNGCVVCARVVCWHSRCDGMCIVICQCDSIIGGCWFCASIPTACCVLISVHYPTVWQSVLRNKNNWNGRNDYNTNKIFTTLSWEGCAMDGMPILVISLQLCVLCCLIIFTSHGKRTPQKQAKPCLVCLPNTHTFSE